MAEIKDKAVGVIVFHKFPRSLKILVLKHSKGHWSFAKGHANQGEKLIHTALRELKEETGITEVEFISKKILITENYVYIQDKDKVKKTVEYFIATSKTEAVKIDKEEIINYKWCTLTTARKIITFKQSKNSLEKAFKEIKRYQSSKNNGIWN